MTETKKKLIKFCKEYTEKDADYFKDVYDAKYLISARGEFLHCELLLAGGGPNIILDTRSKMIVGTWGADKVEIPIDLDTCMRVDEIYETIYEGIR